VNVFPKEAKIFFMIR